MDCTNYTFWITFSQSSTEERTMVYQPSRDSVVIFGSILCGWSLLCHVLLCVIVARKKPFGFSYPVRWLILNFAFAQTLMASFVVPLNVQTERTGHWTAGRALCRAWLGCGVILVALSLWSLFCITVDRLLYVLRPLDYERRVPTSRVKLMLIGCWVMSLLTVIPLIVSVQDPDFILDEVCAIGMSPEYAFAMSSMAFFVPAGMTVLVTFLTVIAVLQARCRLNRLRMQRIPPTDEEPDIDDVTSGSCCTRCGPEVTLLTFADHSTISNVGVTTFCVNMTFIALWSPVYVTNLLIPLCKDICIDPSVWSLLIWVGYATIGVSPILWFLDRNVRKSCRSLVERSPRGCSRPGSDGSSTVCSNSHSNIDALRAFFSKDTSSGTRV